MSSPQPTIPEGDLLREVRDQPRLLRQVQKHCHTLHASAVASRARRWLIGCGDMHFAAQTAEALALAAGRPETRALRSMDLRWASAGLGSEDGVVAASVSGRTPRTVEALQRALARGAAGLVISDDSQAPLASLTTERCILSTTQPEQLAAHVYAGYASEVPQTRTYLAVLSLMCELALGGKGQEPVLPAHFVDNLERQLEAWLGRAVQLAKTMVESAPVARITVLGSGPYFATACYGAAKHLEYAIPAGAQCLEEFHHLQMFVVEEGDWIVGLAPDAASLQRWQEVRNHYRALGARTVEWTVEPEGGLLPSSLLEAVFACTVVLQLQAYALAWQLGRDLQKWVGGRRRDLIFALSQATVRDSRVWLQD